MAPTFSHSAGAGGEVLARIVLTEDEKRDFVRKGWLGVSADMRARIVDDSLRYGSTPDEMILRDVERQSYKRWGEAVPRCLGCDGPLPPFSRPTTHNAVCRQRLRRRRASR